MIVRPCFIFIEAKFLRSIGSLSLEYRICTRGLLDVQSAYLVLNR